MRHHVRTHLATLAGAGDSDAGAGAGAAPGAASGAAAAADLGKGKGAGAQPQSPPSTVSRRILAPAGFAEGPAAVSSPSSFSSRYPSTSAAASAQRLARALGYGTYALGAAASASAAADGAANSSSGAGVANAYNWRLDSSLTDIGFVGDAAFQTDCGSVTITFEAFGGVTSGVAKLAACVGSAPFWCDVAPPRSVGSASGGGAVAGANGAATTVVLTRLALPPGVVSYSSVFAVSGSGVTSAVSTNGVICDDRAPSAAEARVLDTGRYRSAPPSLPGSGRAAKGALPPHDIDCDLAGAGVGAAWSGFESFVSLDHYEWAIGSAPGLTDLQAWTNVGVTTSAFNASVAPPAGSAAFVSVRAVDVIGRASAPARSDGVLLLLPPSPGDAAASAALPGADGPAVNAATTGSLANMTAADFNAASSALQANVTAASAASAAAALQFVCHGSPARLLSGLSAARGAGSAEIGGTGVVGLQKMLLPAANSTA
jgi:hypothetical protein